MKHPFYPSSWIITETQRVAAIAAVVGVIVGLIGGFFIGRLVRQGDEPSESYADEALLEEEIEGGIVISTTTGTGTIERGVRVYEGATESIAVDDQKAGNRVYVAGVALSQPGWVAVRDEVDGEGGWILGAQWFPEGEHDGTIELLRGTLAGSRYHAYLFLDDGDKKFDPHKDTPVTHDGLLILKPFTTY